MNKPELLAPAGNLEKLKTAFLYGADAVYLAGPSFGLRQGASNFNYHQLQAGVNWAHERAKKVYLTLNAMPFGHEMENLPEYLEFLSSISPDALIISDPGVFHICKKYTDIELHVSTQASVTNSATCEYWKNAGATRIVVAREVTLDECMEIKKKLDIELEMFIHGSMCIGYSGKCTFSNYTAGRDANRGGCIQNCRHTYEVKKSDSFETLGSYNLMDSKDLWALNHIPAILKSGVDSLKIEGRMKSNLYVASTVSAYRQLIDQVASENYNQLIAQKKEQLESISNRGFFSGSLEQPLDENSVRYHQSGYQSKLTYLGTVKAVLNENRGVVHLKGSFTPEEPIYALLPGGDEHPLIYLGSKGEQPKPNSLINVETTKPLTPYTAIYKKND